MGKKKNNSGGSSSSHGNQQGGTGGGGGEKENKKSKAFVLKVAMHCTCKGCVDKIRGAVKDLTLLHGVESWDQSALATKGELRLVTAADADPERLRHRLHRATRKAVDLVFLPPTTEPTNRANGRGGNSGNSNNDAAAAQAQAMLLNTLLQQQQQQSAWAAANNQLQLMGGYGAQAYHPSCWPGAVPQQPDPYGWGAYNNAYHPPPAPPQGLGAGGGAWHWGGHGHGY